jgi:hypothetical protein
MRQRASGSVLLLIATLLIAACGSTPPRAGQTMATTAVIEPDLAQLRSDGLYGPPHGLRALHYEYCIESSAVRLQAAKAIDPTFSSQTAAGRSACRSGEVLGMGNTHQPGAREIIRRLARIPGVRRIRESVFE